MRGTVRKISIPRRLVADLMHASVRVPFVSLTRPVNVRPLLEARAQAANPPGWAAIFVKAFALVATASRDPTRASTWYRAGTTGSLTLPPWPRA